MKLNKATLTKSLVFTLVFLLAFSSIFLVRVRSARVLITAHGAIPNDGLDDSAAFNASIAEVVGEKGGVVDVPPGRWEITSGVAQALNNTSVTLRGEPGGRSQIHIATGAQTDGFLIQGAGGARFEHLTYFGTLPYYINDARHVFNFNQSHGEFYKCRFVGLRGHDNGGHIIRAVGGSLDIYKTDFEGCAAIAGLGGSIIYQDMWSFMRYRDGLIADYGTLDDVFYTKTAYLAYAGVFLQRPLVSENSNTGGEVLIENVRMDETAAYGLHVYSDPWAGGASVPVVNVRNLKVNVNSAGASPETSGVYVRNVKRVNISDSWFGYTNSGTHYAIQANECGSVVIDNVVAKHAADKFKIINTTSLQIIDSVFNEAGTRAVSSPKYFTVTKNGTTSVSKPYVVTSLASYPLTESDRTVEMNASAQPGVALLPPAARANGHDFTIIKGDPSTNTVTVVADGQEKINDNSTYQLGFKWATVTVRSNGTAWRVVP